MFPLLRRLSWVAAGLAFVVGCAESVNEDPLEPDAGTARPDATAKDAGKDGAASDAGRDATTSDGGDASVKDAAGDGSVKDATSDATTDAGVDASDGGSDATADATPDAIADTGSDAPPLPCGLVINEILTGVIGATDYEFVEVYNSCSTPIAVDGFKLAWRSGLNLNPVDATNDDGDLYVWPASSTIPGNGYRVIGGQAYTGAKDGTMPAGLLRNANGSVGLRDAAGKLIDSVGYGAVSVGNAFIERLYCRDHDIVASPGNSIGRKPNGKDTNDNSVDWVVLTTPTPGQANQ